MVFRFLIFVYILGCAFGADANPTSPSETRARALFVAELLETAQFVDSLEGSLPGLERVEELASEVRSLARNLTGASDPRMCLSSPKIGEAVVSLGTLIVNTYPDHPLFGRLFGAYQRWLEACVEEPNLV